MMSENEKLKYGMEHRGALEGYADADWWRALSIDINSLDDGIEKELKRKLFSILKGYSQLS